MTRLRAARNPSQCKDEKRHTGTRCRALLRSTPNACRPSLHLRLTNDGRCSGDSSHDPTAPSSYICPDYYGSSPIEPIEVQGEFGDDFYTYTEMTFEPCRSGPPQCVHHDSICMCHAHSTCAAALKPFKPFLFCPPTTSYTNSNDRAAYMPRASSHSRVCGTGAPPSVPSSMHSLAKALSLRCRSSPTRRITCRA